MKVRNYGVLLGSIIVGLILASCDDPSPTVADPAATAVHDHPGMNAKPSGNLSVPGGFTVEGLARGGFPDDINVNFRIKLSNATNVVQVTSPSDAVVARVTIQPGGSLGWHTHHGPAIATVASGALSIINASDCVRRVYAGGKAFVDPGQGNVHVGFNETANVTVVYVTFLDVPVGQPATIPADPACDS